MTPATLVQEGRSASRLAALVALRFTAAGGLALEDPVNDLAEPVKARGFSRPGSLYWRQLLPTDDDGGTGTLWEARLLSSVVRVGRSCGLVDREWTTAGDFETSLALECFNVFNESTVLRRNSRLEASTTDWVQEVVNPRVFRFSTRLRFQ